MIGQWLAHLAGLGYLLDPERVRQALQAIFRHNWRADLYEHANCQRVYALNDERWFLLCSWPHGGRPAFPFPYSDEVWCGIEYQVASHLIYEGLVDEGLAIVRGVRERHDGRRRNPWNEFECGSHYARSLASWTLLTALSGFSFDLTRGAIGFAPRLGGEEFRTFWSVDSGWGTYRQRQEEGSFRVRLRLEYGKLALQELCLPGGGGPLGRPGQVRASLKVRPVQATLRVATQFDGARPALNVAFDQPVALLAGDELVVELGPSLPNPRSED